MDYGQTQKQPEVPQDFFTVGAGTNSEDINNVNPEDNLDLTNDQASWEPQFMQMPPDNITEPIRNIETPPIPDTTSMESVHNSQDTIDSAKQGVPSLDSTKNTPELGKVTSASPQNKEPIEPSELEQRTKHYFGLHDLTSAIASGKLTHHGMEAVNNAENKLNQDGDAASFYENLSYLREQNKTNARNTAGEIL